MTMHAKKPWIAESQTGKNRQSDLKAATGFQLLPVMVTIMEIKRNKISSHFLKNSSVIRNLNTADEKPSLATFGPSFSRKAH